MSAPFAYRPLPGSIADRVIRHLQQQPPGTELATAVLADLVRYLQRMGEIKLGDQG